MVPIANTVSRLLAWWLGELAACVPGRARALITRTPAALVITPGDDVADVALYRRRQLRQLGQIPLAPQNAPRRALSSLLDRASLRNLDIVVNVPADKVLRRIVVLPLEAAENLREVLAFEMDRHTPFKASDVAYDYRLMSTDTAARKLTVDLAVVPRPMLEQVASVADSLGVAANRIGIAGDEPTIDGSFNFRPYEESGDRPEASRALLFALTATAVVLAVIAWYLPLYFDDRLLSAYQMRLEQTRTTALQAEELKKRLTAAMGLNRFLVDRRAATPTVTSLLADVTDRLPDDTWLTQLQLQDGKLTLKGVSPSAAALIAPLEASPLLTEVRFGSPVTPDPRIGGESFDILAKASFDRGS
jgi:general secretion pathway protein L